MPTRSRPAFWRVLFWVAVATASVVLLYIGVVGMIVKG
jgi:hypothetical protein